MPGQAVSEVNQKQKLSELGGLNCEGPNANPAQGPIHFPSDEEHRQQQDHGSEVGQGPKALPMGHGQAQHGEESEEGHPHVNAVPKGKGVGAAVAHGGNLQGGGGHQQGAQGQQNQPQRRGGPFEARGGHAQAPRRSARSATAASKASPRCSKERY